MSLHNELSAGISYNVQGLCVRQGIEKQKINNLMKMIEEQKDDGLHVSPACTKPNVTGSTVKL